MAVVGLDLGSFKSVIAAARNRGIDILTNEVSNRFTPSVVGFLGNRRLLGEAAKTQVRDIPVCLLDFFNLTRLIFRKS